MHTARFAHSRLAAYHVILEALVRGDAVARALPRGYAKLADQLRRALLGAFYARSGKTASDPRSLVPASSVSSSF